MSKVNVVSGHAALSQSPHVEVGESRSAKKADKAALREKTAARHANRKFLDTTEQTEVIKEIAKHLADNVIEQYEACHGVLRALERAMTLRPERGPAASLLIAGKTGVGKNKTAEELAKAIGGEPVVVPCTDYQEKHEVASLIGAPPSYVGHGETVPKLTQERIDKAKGKKVPVTVIVLDEFEKAHPNLWNWWLKALDDGKAEVWTPKPGSDSKEKNKGAASQTIDFSSCIIIATSNAGAEVIGASRDFKPLMGFSPKEGAPSEVTPEEEKKAVEQRIRERFSKDELLGRFNELVIARELSDAGYRKIIDRELRRIRRQVERGGTKALALRLTTKTKDWLLKKSNRKVYGARQLSKCMDNEILSLLARLVLTNSRCFRIGERDLS